MFFAKQKTEKTVCNSLCFTVFAMPSKNNLFQNKTKTIFESGKCHSMTFAISHINMNRGLMPQN